MVPQAAVPGVLVGMLGRFREFALAHTHLQGLVLEYQVPRVRYGGNIIIRVDKLYTGDTVKTYRRYCISQPIVLFLHP